MQNEAAESRSLQPSHNPLSLVEEEIGFGCIGVTIAVAREETKRDHCVEKVARRPWVQPESLAQGFKRFGPVRELAEHPKLDRAEKRFIFADISSVDAADARLTVRDLGGGSTRTLLAGADGRLLPSGQLAFMRSGTLMTVPFDAARASVSGEPIVAMRHVMQTGLRVRAGANNTGAGMFAVSSSGALAVVRGNLAGGEDNRLVFVDKSGRAEPAEPTAGAPSGGRLVPRISPDGSRLITTVITVLKWELWIADWNRGIWTQCTDCKGAFGSIPKAWSPDSHQLLLLQPGLDTLAAHTIDGSKPDRIIVREPGRGLSPAQWLIDGKIVYVSTPGGNITNTQTEAQEIKVIDEGSQTGRRIALGLSPSVSPNRRWLAFMSRESGEPNIVVQTFPEQGQRQQVSAGGGSDPAWSADGRTLYYFRPLPDTRTGVLMAVDIPDGSALAPGVPREVLRWPSQTCAAVRCYEIAPDGRFLFSQPANSSRPSIVRIDVALNWAPPSARDR